MIYLADQHYDCQPYDVIWSCNIFVPQLLGIYFVVNMQTLNVLFLISVVPVFKYCLIYFGAYIFPHKKGSDNIRLPALLHWVQYIYAFRGNSPTRVTPQPEMVQYWLSKLEPVGAIVIVFTYWFSVTVDDSLMTEISFTNDEGLKPLCCKNS